jgi:hypothetical protein
MKKLLIALLIATPLTLEAAKYKPLILHPTIPGTNIRDFSNTQPSYKLNRNSGLFNPTIPGTTIRDFSGERPDYKPALNPLKLKWY